MELEEWNRVNRELRQHGLSTVDLLPPDRMTQTTGQCDARTCMHAHTVTQTHTVTYTLCHMHACTQACTHAQRHINTHKHMHTYTVYCII